MTIDVTKMYMSEKGFNPLHFASFNNNYKAVQILCEYVLQHGFGDDPD
jgi:ankyrin repeat protein